MLSRALFVITLTGWVIYLTYTTMAATFVGVPNLPEATRAAVLSLLVTAGFALLLRAFGVRLVARLATELRRTFIEAWAVDVRTPRPTSTPTASDELYGIHPEVLEAGLRIRRRLEGD